MDACVKGIHYKSQHKDEPKKPTLSLLPSMSTAVLKVGAVVGWWLGGNSHVKGQALCETRKQPGTVTILAPRCTLEFRSDVFYPGSLPKTAAAQALRLMLE